QQPACPDALFNFFVVLRLLYSALPGHNIRTTIVATISLTLLFHPPTTQVRAKLFTCSALDRHSALNTCTLGHVESSSDSATLSGSDSYRGSFFCLSLNRAHPITRTHDGGGVSAGGLARCGPG